MSLPLILAAGATSTSTSTPLPSPSPTSTPGLPDVSLDGVKAALMDACGQTPGFLCRTVYDSTHSDYLASLAQFFFGTPVTIILIVLLATIIRSLLHRLIKRTTRHMASVTGNGGLLRGGLFGDSAILLERRRQRAETVGSLLRSVVSIVVYGIGFVLVLGELGINLAPIVASAGVLGIAVGFGAQNLVKDFLSGIFMLLEDQYGVGDVVDVGGTISGTVEAVTFRMTRLRDVEGTVWYVRNGEITRIGNKSQQWARTVLDVPLDYDTDVARAKDVLLETTQTMWRDDRWALLILEEPEVWGMESMTADGYTLRVAVKTLPLKQWDVARELRERLRLALVGAGISLGALQRSLVVVDDDEEAEPSSEEEEEAEPGAPPQLGDAPPRIDPPAQPGPLPSSGPGAARG
ncbi:mechanosensitive ion channel family protein [Pseudofrankia asymbiotica]|uniref:Mechanosensitive ion channel protein MscS n=1 Tax=Pseudofrankia asymbiotica TaxID=1834516 RepID=A0A1V2IJ77_9ACTN|nr:mechanosensitive ion channel family protein [Pseudofrankia asymbiotica]ONH33085.1 mechanosensitive ion channel protein MscS [Pseudofrankia asymbiotica]